MTSIYHSDSNVFNCYLPVLERKIFQSCELEHKLSEAVGVSAIDQLNKCEKPLPLELNQRTRFASTRGRDLIEGQEIRVVMTSLLLGIVLLSCAYSLKRLK